MLETVLKGKLWGNIKRGLRFKAYMGGCDVGIEGKVKGGGYKKGISFKAYSTWGMWGGKKGISNRGICTWGVVEWALWGIWGTVHSLAPLQGKMKEIRPLMSREKWGHCAVTHRNNKQT